MVLLEQKLIYLTDSLVPSNIKEQSPQFYELIKAFLANIENVQTSINNKFLDVIDISKIKNDEILKLYLDTYTAQFGFERDLDYKTLTNVIKVSKELSTRKGTILIYTILTKLLVYLLPQIGTTYSEKLDLYNNSTDETVKAELEIELETLRINNWDLGILNYFYYNGTTEDPQEFDSSNPENENIIPYRYRIESDYEESIFNKYFKEFCHPLGWELEFINIIYRFLIDTANLSCNFYLYDCFVLPELYVGDEVYTSEDGLDNLVKYPFTIYDKTILDSYTLERYNEILSSVTNTSAIQIDNNNIVYNFDNFNTELPYDDINEAVLRERNGNSSDLDNLDYSLKAPNDGGLALVGQKYYYNNKISNWNGGVLTNNDSNTVVYQQFISNVKK